ncbi:MAG: NADH-quinone oxidoreductase subunit J [Rhodospirillaceae bacterium]|jgi:NADH-quinone oxidoreductase subunit J|nr:NADH-quinone oxidoreductase subunit J [Rhodospirillaceae bacterium]MBT5083714.1 NADH-quinone oxidoreductase subunit J [Rhodospirillaceae bacterium]MBT5522590.1 NADH-quinone oxidoreductase subunit J [Rhodospirillaceae bacterium]MBT5878634.1 NADH-quinone oxidoreductase subunit J [Rhodospirillaceae bacterium]MBT6591125.1 NADH-quinone oxidoreductase subunit J [Rhodospirillaceae bacterium]
MILQGLTFYVFAAIAVAAGVMVVSARNPVHSVLFLILTFFTTAALFVLIGAEFLAMVLVVVYVGAVAVLFMFVVMMLDINFVEMREGFLQYMPIGVLVGIILLVELLMVLGTASMSPEVLATGTEPIPDIAHRQNTAAIGDVIYTKYIYLFQAAGMILLIAMVGAIVLTLRQRPGVKKQNIAEQVSRRREDSVELKKVQPGQGI